MYDIRKFKSFPGFKKRFLSFLPENYSTPEMKDQCWKWKGPKDIQGYGNISWSQNNLYKAHRISYIIFKDLIPYGQIVRHTCDNPSCVNPNHLILGDWSDNSNDMISRNRGGNQKLTSDDVKIIKWMLKYKPERGLATKLAKKFKVSQSIISNIKANRIWNCIETP